MNKVAYEMLNFFSQIISSSYCNRTWTCALFLKYNYKCLRLKKVQSDLPICRVDVTEAYRGRKEFQKWGLLGREYISAEALDGEDFQERFGKDGQLEWN